MNPRIHFPVTGWTLKLCILRNQADHMPVHHRMETQPEIQNYGFMRVCESMRNRQQQRRNWFSILLAKLFIKGFEKSSAFSNYCSVTFNVLNSLFLEFKDRHCHSLNDNPNKLQKLKLLYLHQVRGTLSISISVTNICLSLNSFRSLKDLMWV